MPIRSVIPDDDEAVGRIITPIVRAGETYALPSDWTETISSSVPIRAPSRCGGGSDSRSWAGCREHSGIRR